MRRKIALLLTAAFLVSLAACGKSAYYETTFFAMDTVITIRLSRTAKDGARLAETELAEAAGEAEKIVLRIEAAISRTREDSDTARLNCSAVGIESENADFLAVLARALAVAEETDGAYSPALGTLTELWDIAGGGHVPTADELSSALAHTDYRTVSVTGSRAGKSDSGVLIDLGGIGKGYAAARLIEYFTDSPIACGLVSLGGNVGVFGEKADKTAYRIGVSDPRGEDVAGYLTIPDGFVSVSGDYERYFVEDGVRYHHIFDSQSGYPADSGLCSAAVWSGDGTLADALSTALFVMGAERAMEYYRAHPGTFEAVLITSDGEIVLTPGLEDGGFETNKTAYSLAS